MQSGSMMSKLAMVLVTALALVVTLVGGTSVTASAAAQSGVADRGSSVVTRAEFRRVKQGMRIDRVHAISDAAGRQSYYDGGCCGGALSPSQLREYRTSNRNGIIHVGYDKTRGTWKVTSKRAYWR